MSGMRSGKGARKWDSDNSLGTQLQVHIASLLPLGICLQFPGAIVLMATLPLQEQHRHGDPQQHGVIWPRIAELSLVGALGCGGWLLQLICEQAPCSPLRPCPSEHPRGFLN